MKICYLADAVNVHTRRWVNFFAQKHEVHVISFRPANLPGVKVHYIPVPFGKFGYLLGAGKIARLVHRLSPTLLHAHHATSYGFVGALSGYHPYFISSWGSDVMWSPHQFFLFDWMLRFNFRQADQITATSQMLAKATETYCSAGTKVHIIPFGVDTDLFSPPLHPKADTSDNLVIGIVKTLRPRYGVRELILAFSKVSASFPKTKLVIVGGGEQYDALQKLVINLRLEDKTTLVGQVSHEDTLQYLQSFDIFVVPSIRESFGVAAVEASACGLPVIASRVGGLPEVVLDGKTGILVPPGDVDALAKAISQLLVDSTLRQQMGRAGRQFVLEHYRWEDNARQMEHLYYQTV